MTDWQKYFILCFGIVSFAGLLWSFFNVKKGNVFGKTGIFNTWGAFVVGDMIVFGVFWILVSAVVLILKDWILFLLIVSIFWLVRSLGETIYWFNQQFSTIIRNPPENFPTYKLFKSDSVWWVHQIFWQCLTVISLIFSIYYAAVWVKSI